MARQSLDGFFLSASDAEIKAQAAGLNRRQVCSERSFDSSFELSPGVVIYDTAGERSDLVLSPSEISKREIRARRRRVNVGPREADLREYRARAIADSVSGFVRFPSGGTIITSENVSRERGCDVCAPFVRARELRESMGLDGELQEVDHQVLMDHWDSGECPDEYD